MKKFFIKQPIALAVMIAIGSLFCSNAVAQICPPLCTPELSPNHPVKTLYSDLNTDFFEYRLQMNDLYYLRNHPKVYRVKKDDSGFLRLAISMREKANYHAKVIADVSLLPFAVNKKLIGISKQFLLWDATHNNPMSPNFTEKTLGEYKTWQNKLMNTQKVTEKSSLF